MINSEIERFNENAKSLFQKLDEQEKQIEILTQEKNDALARAKTAEETIVVFKKRASDELSRISKNRLINDDNSGGINEENDATLVYKPNN